MLVGVQKGREPGMRKGEGKQEGANAFLSRKLNERGECQRDTLVVETRPKGQEEATLGLAGKLGPLVVEE